MTSCKPGSCSGRTLHHGVSKYGAQATVAQLFKIFPVSYQSRMLATVFTTTGHSPFKFLNEPSLQPSILFPLSSILIISAHLHSYLLHILPLNLVLIFRRNVFKIQYFSDLMPRPLINLPTFRISVVPAYSGHHSNRPYLHNMPIPSSATTPSEPFYPRHMA